MKKISEAHQAEIKKQQESLQSEAAERARIYLKSLPMEDKVSEHKYLQDKHVYSYGTYLDKKTNTAVIPLFNIQKKLMTLQWIYPDGTKRFFPSAPKKGAFFSVALDTLKSDKANKYPILICEGYATMASVYEVTIMPCVAARDCGNLFDVAQAIKTQYPERRIIIAADNDHKTKGNPGLTTANDVCKRLKLNGVVYPVFKEDDNGTDWNDYYVKYGEDKTREELTSQIRDKYYSDEEKQEIQAREKLKSLVSDLDPSIQLEPQEFIGGMFPRKFISAIVAQSGTGKTMFLQKFCSDLSIGGSIFDGFVEEEPARMCLIFSGEAGLDLMIKRGAQTKWPIYPPRVKVIDQRKFDKNDVSIMLDDDDGWKNICRLTDMYKPDIIFFDSLISFHEKDENKAAEMKPIFKRLNDLAERANCAIILIHHSRKRAAKERTLSLNQDDVIGSSILNRLVGLIIGIEPMKEDEKTLLVRTLKTWFTAFMPFTYKISEDFYGNTVMETDLAPASVNNSKIAIWNYLIQTFTPDEWFSPSVININSINPPVTIWQLRRVLADFVKTGKLQKKGTTRDTTYSLKNFHE